MHARRVRHAREEVVAHADDHRHENDGVVVQYLGVYEPRKCLTEDAARIVHRPIEHVHLIRLHEMLGPMREDDHHEGLERALVPRTIQFFNQALHDGERPNKGGKAKLSPDSKPSSAGGFHPGARVLSGRRKLSPLGSVSAPISCRLEHDQHDQREEG